jgi:hypothetical protein
MDDVSWTEAVTAVVAVLALGITLYNSYQQYAASRRGVRFVVSNFGWEDPTLEHLRFTLLIMGFNERDAYTGARNICVKFLDKDEEELVSTRLRDVVDGYYADYLNFPPHQWVVKMYRGEIVVDLANCDTPQIFERYNKARLVVRLPNAHAELEVRLDGAEDETTIGGR